MKIILKMFSETFKNNKELVNYLIKSGVLKSKILIDAFLNIDRKNFVMPEFINEAYCDHPLPIGENQTISQPWTVAFMLELLQPMPGNKVLDIGFGSGWTTALLAFVVSKNADGKVFGIEINPKVYEFGKKNIEKYNFIEKGIVEIYLMNGSKGLPQKSPFNRILVSAAAKFIPEELKNQLDNDGILVIPTDDGKIWKITKENEKFLEESYDGFVFVPLIE